MLSVHLDLYREAQSLVLALLGKKKIGRAHV